MIQFIVGDIKNYNSFTVFLHYSKMKALGLKEGDAVRILSSAKKSVYARVARAVQNAPVSNVLMSRALRVNLCCYLGQIVLVEKAQNLPIATSVQVAPIEDTIEGIDGNFLNYLKKSKSYNFESLPVQTEMVLPVRALGRIIEFVVVKCSPAQAVVITDVSQLQSDGEPFKRRKQLKPFDVPCYDSIAGLDDILYDLRSDIELPLVQPQIFDTLGCKTHQGILITAPEGCGKTLIGHAIKHETPVHFEFIPGLDLMTKKAGEAGFILKRFADRAIAKAPSIVFIDDIDIIAKEQIYQDGAVDKRLSWALMATLDKLVSHKGIVVVATATNYEDLGDELRMPNRFSKRLVIQRPNEEQRKHIIDTLTKSVRISQSMTKEQLYNELKGQTGAELHLEIQRMLILQALNFMEVAARSNRDVISASDMNKVMIGEPDAEEEEVAEIQEHGQLGGDPYGASQNPFGNVKPDPWASSAFGVGGQANPFASAAPGPAKSPNPFESPFPTAQDPFRTPAAEAPPKPAPVAVPVASPTPVVKPSTAPAPAPVDNKSRKLSKAEQKKQKKEEKKAKKKTKKQVDPYSPKKKKKK